MHTHIPIHSMREPVEARRGALDPLEVEIGMHGGRDGCEPPCAGMLGTNRGLLQGHLNH